MSGARPRSTSSITSGQSYHTNPALTVRQTLNELNALDAATADYLNTLAFVLMRVADADLRVCDQERQCIERILVEQAEIPEEQAVLVVEIARHRCQIADCGSTYSVSRNLRGDLGSDNKRHLVHFLRAVADADGQVSSSEEKVICQIATELGCNLPLLA